MASSPMPSAHDAECRVHSVHVELLKQTISNYASLPEELLKMYDPAQCQGECAVLRTNFAAVWKTNTSLNLRFEKEMEHFREIVKRQDDRIMEVEVLNELLERSLAQTNVQLAEKRRVELVDCPTDLGDIELFFHKKLDEKDASIEVLRNRISDLETKLYCKEQESIAKQMQINHMLTLPNQLEHASEVNKMRVRLLDAENKVQEMTLAVQAAEVSFSTQTLPNTTIPGIKITSNVDLTVDRMLWERFNEFFRYKEQDVVTSSYNLEDYLCDQFLLDQPNQKINKLRPDMYTRGEVVEAVHVVCGQTKKKKKRKLERMCKQDFASCLAAMGGRYKCKKGLRYWVNVEITRRPYFAWDV